MYGVVSLIWENPPGAFWIRCHWNRLSPSSGGPLGSHGRTWYRNNWLLADDNARPHRDCVVYAYLHEQDIIRMDWALYRPDMNSIEHIWDEIGRGVEGLDPQSVNLRQLGVVVQNLRQQIPLERVQTLVSSMPRSIHALLTPGGAPRNTELSIHWD